jgi:hypothetical protein
MATDQIDGFILEASALSNMPGSDDITHARFIIAAESADEAIWLVGKLGFLDAKVIECGPSVLKEVRGLEIPDKDARPYSPRKQFRVRRDVDGSEILASSDTDQLRCHQADGGPPNMPESRDLCRRPSMQPYAQGDPCHMIFNERINTLRNDDEDCLMRANQTRGAISSLSHVPLSAFTRGGRPLSRSRPSWL